MIFSCISDIHIQKTKDKGSKVLESFLSHPKVQASDEVYLLGDIFDVFVGNSQIYKNMFGHELELIKSFSEKSGKIYYLEGNHDLHFEKLIKEYGAISLNRPKSIEVNDKKFLLTHGDELDQSDRNYLMYKKFISSNFFKFLTHRILPSKFLYNIAAKASQSSRERGEKYFDPEAVKQRLRDEVSRLNLPYDYIISGHYHVQDDFEYSPGKRYLNIGFPRRDQSFIHWDESQLTHHKI